MSDEKKPTKPLKNPEVHVNVVPKNKGDQDHKKIAENVQKKLGENVKRALEEKKSDGKEKQFEAAENEAKKAAEGTNSQEIEKIRVRVIGRDEDGDKTGHEWEVTPKENKSAS